MFKNISKIITYVSLFVFLFLMFSKYTFADTSNNSTNTFRVAAYNIGNFSRGTQPYGTGGDTIYNSLINFFEETNADIYLLSEWDEFFNKDNNIMAETKFSNLGYTFSSVGICNANYSYPFQMNMIRNGLTMSNNTNLTCYNRNDKDYGCGFLDTPVMIDNRTVHFISTHFQFQSKIGRDNEIDQLLDYITNNNIDYFVIGGDFNMGYYNDGLDFSMDTVINDINKFTSFTTIPGLLSAQGNSLFGDFTHINNSKTYYLFNTWHNSKTGKDPIDDIIISSNLYFKNIFTAGNNKASDHMAIVVDIGFKDSSSAEPSNGYIVTSANTTAGDVIKNVNVSMLTAIFDHDSNVHLSNDTIIKTNDAIRFEESDVVNPLVVKGDVEGNGCVYLDGIKRTARQILNANELTSVYKLAADYNGDGFIKMNDVMMMLDNIISGWEKYGDSWYYFDEFGKMTRGLSKAEWKGVTSLYYFDQLTGKMQLGWQHINGSWYYFVGGGAAATGLQQVEYNGKTSWYYFDPLTGKMLTGLQTIGDETYYFKPSTGGTMAADECINIDSIEYCFDTAGICISDQC